MTFDQQEFDIRFEWGEQGVITLAPISDVVIIVDVLSFSTSVDIAVNQGATVFPYRGAPEALDDYAASVGAVVAARQRNTSTYSLSPESLLTIQAGTRLVLPSANGSTLTMAARPKPVLAGCLRNAKAVAAAAVQYGNKIAVIAAGERWRPEGSLRPALEDLLGAGAIISQLPGHLSPEALSASVVFSGIETELTDHLRLCSSGKELIEAGFEQDVILAAQLNISEVAPILIDEAYDGFQPGMDKPDRR
jgi:2-phosphosulfolactate phosphatase